VSILFSKKGLRRDAKMAGMGALRVNLCPAPKPSLSATKPRMVAPKLLAAWGGGAAFRQDYLLELVMSKEKDVKNLADVQQLP
jgi:hypothetical protein